MKTPTPSGVSKASFKPGVRGGKLKAPPIMAYPASEEERILITTAASVAGGRGMSVSAFVMDSAARAARKVLAERSEPIPENLPELSQTQDDEPEETREQRTTRIIEHLRLLMKDAIAEHGGAEGYMRWVRSDEDKAQR